MRLELIISREMSGLRLDQALCRMVPDLSRSRAVSLVSEGAVLVDGQSRRPGYRVKAGETISGCLPAETDAEPVPEDLALSVVYEDSHILVVDKPPGMVVHPAPGHDTGTLVNALIARDPAFAPDLWEDPRRPGIVHRLDQDTSGLIILAKTPQSLAFLQKEFKQRRVEKQYLALVQGEDIPDEGVIELPIGRHPKKRKLMAVQPESGRYAKTGFRVEQRLEGCALLSLRLYTGRTHQIRVHCYHQGMPLMGDAVYQVRRFRKQNRPVPRQMLHSWRLGLRHPYSGRRMEFQAPLPHDFQAVMNALTRAESGPPDMKTP